MNPNYFILWNAIGFTSFGAFFIMHAPANVYAQARADFDLIPPMDCFAPSSNQHCEIDI